VLCAMKSGNASLRARDRYFSCVESSEFLLHARV